MEARAAVAHTAIHRTENYPTPDVTHAKVSPPCSTESVLIINI